MKVPKNEDGNYIETLEPGQIYVLRTDHAMIMHLDMFLHAIPENFRAIKATSEHEFEYVPYIPTKMVDSKMSMGVAPLASRKGSPREASEGVTEAATSGNVPNEKAKATAVAEAASAMGATVGDTAPRKSAKSAGTRTAKQRDTATKGLSIDDLLGEKL